MKQPGTIRIRPSGVIVEHIASGPGRLGNIVLCAILTFGYAFGLAAAGKVATVDKTKLPPPAQRPIDFDKDVKPVLEENCFRCHGPEKPKSHFRLDNREAALKGGDNGADIIPGDSTNSPLIHYVSRLVEDMEMPPPGKGRPLSAEQTGVLRAWIDQGANWGQPATFPAAAFTAAPTLRWISVEGDRHKFREIEGVREGVGGGVEQFEMKEQLDANRSVSVEGHALFPDDDIKVKLDAHERDLGFFRAGFEQWRRYYDDTGGYYRPLTIPSFDLGRDLHLDTGRAWVELGFTPPSGLQVVLGYEYQYRQGAKSTLEWGPVIGPTSTNNIYPAAKNIDEHTHVVRLDVTHDFAGWHLEDNARVEIYELKTLHSDATSVSIGPPPNSILETREGATHIQGMNTVHLERQVRDWWLFSGGYLYSKLQGDASFDQMTVNSIGLPTSGAFWSSDALVLKRESHIVSMGNLFTPTPWLSGSLGVQSEWTRQDGAGNVHLDQGDPNLPNSFVLFPNVVRSSLDEQKVGEIASLRFTKIPATVLFADARLAQDSIGQFEEDLPEPGVTPDHESNFLRDTDYANERHELRAGFETSPFTWASLSAHYKKTVSDSDYNNHRDLTFTNALQSLNDAMAEGVPNAGYSAFIRHRKIDEDEAEAKLTLRPASWIKTTLTYKVTSTDYSTKTDPVPFGTIPEGLLAGVYDSHIYGVNVSMRVLQPLMVSGTFTYTQSRTHTAQNGDQSIVPYAGDIYSLMASATYVLDKATQLQASYAFSQGNYGQNNVAAGLPLGLDYTRHALSAGLTRRLNRALTSNLRYAFYRYSEPNTGGLNDYTAHGVFATLMVRWP